MTSTVLIEIRDNIQIMTLSNVPARNAATLEMAEAMAAALDELERNPALQVGIVTGAGGTFCAAVEGYALAGGFEVALACDLIVAANNAKFGLPEVKRGLAATAGGLLRLPKRLPYHIAMECILTGDMLSAERAHAHGLINRLTEPGQALQAALELARTVAANGPLAVIASKRVAQESADWPQSDMFERQSAITAPVFASQDAREGASAFAEKRAPVWRGI